MLHYDEERHVLTAEDPQFIYYLRNLAWNEFAARVGYADIEFPSRYDIALSFAGANRTIAERLFELLADHDLSVFYDKKEQHRILAENVEEYLGPIYRTEASLVVALLSSDYPSRIWTKFESQQFKSRFKSGSVVPIWFKDSPPGMFDESGTVGGVTFNPSGDVDEQLKNIVDTIVKKLGEQRLSGK